MSDAPHQQDDFTRSAGRQLALFGVLAIAGVAVLMAGLAWASGLTGSAAGNSAAVDPATSTVSLVMREEPPQLNSTLATDQVSLMVLGHVMEGLRREQ